MAAFNMMSEELLPVFAPIIVYWICAAIYEVILCPMDQHRLFTKEEETQNLASRRQVLAVVLVNQAMQMALATLIFMSGYFETAGAAAQSPSLLRIVGQLAVAILVLDFWQYFCHRWCHENKFLYKYLHAMHHQLIVPYTYGALYSHPVEGFVADILGGLVATFVSGMSPRMAALFFCLMAIKGIDDHCGMWFPNYPLHRWMANNTAFHALHHQRVGIKSNYSVYNLVIWDRLLGTYLPFSVEPRKEGGYQLRTAKDNIRTRDI